MGLKPINDVIKHVLKKLLWLLENDGGAGGRRGKTTQEAIGLGLMRGDGDCNRRGKTEVVRSGHMPSVFGRED